MRSNIDSFVMLNSTRLALVILVAALGLAPGCNNNETASAPAPPEPLPKIHPGGTPPPAAVPVSVSAPGSDEVQVAEKGIIAAVLEEREMFKRTRRLSELLAKLGPEGIDEAKDLLKNRDFYLGAAENALIARYWALHEPAAATRWALFQAPRGLKIVLTIPTMELWAMKSPIDAQLQVQAIMLLPDFDPSGAELGLVSGWFQSETPGLEDYIRGLGPGKIRQRALRHLARLSLREYGPEATIDWAVSVPEDDTKFKLAVFRQVASELGKSHIAHALQFCEAHCDSRFGQDMRKMIAQRWASYDGRAAMEWVAKAPPGQEQVWAVKAAYSGWLGADRQGLQDWLDAMGPEGVEPWFQPGIEMTAVHAGKRDPKRGLEWARAITNSEARRRTLVTIGINWRKRDPEAADAWLLNAPVPEESRQVVRAYGRPRAEVKADREAGTLPTRATPAKEAAP